MNSALRVAVAAIALFAATACSSGLTQTPLPDAGSQPVQAPVSNTSSPDENETSDISADDAPVSHTPSAKTATPPAAAAPHGGCGREQLPGRRDCDAVVHPQPRRSACGRAAPYCASDLQAAYGVADSAKSGGKGLTVAVVDAYGYPNAAADLAVYRKSMGLSACAVSSGCLKVVNQNGRAAPLPKINGDASDDWRPQQAVDVDMVSAMCPNCKIVLVQANSSKNADLAAGVNAAAALGAIAISNSYSGPETNGGDAAYARRGRAVVASSGNGGFGARQPCSYAGVVCVGGTALLAASTARRWTERAWRSTGSGCSQYVARPSWQHVRGCSMRLETDIAAVADPATGVATYESEAGGWQEAGGTGVAAPIVAALFALGPRSGRANAPQWIWRHAGSSAYRDIVGGENGECSISYLCRARPGYDGPTGWGAPAGASGF